MDNGNGIQLDKPFHADPRRRRKTPEPPVIPVRGEQTEQARVPSTTFGRVRPLSIDAPAIKSTAQRRAAAVCEVRRGPCHAKGHFGLA